MLSFEELNNTLEENRQNLGEVPAHIVKYITGYSFVGQNSSVVRLSKFILNHMPYDQLNKEISSNIKSLGINAYEYIYMYVKFSDGGDVVWEYLLKRARNAQKWTVLAFFKDGEHSNYRDGDLSPQQLASGLGDVANIQDILIITKDENRQKVYIDRQNNKSVIDPLAAKASYGYGDEERSIQTTYSVEQVERILAPKKAEHKRRLLAIAQGRANKAIVMLQDLYTPQYKEYEIGGAFKAFAGITEMLRGPYVTPVNGRYTADDVKKLLAYYKPYSTS